MFKRSFKFALILFLIIVFISFCLNFVSAANCWQYTSNATGECTSANGCTWKSDSWGSWCQELNCWSLYSQSECTTTNIPGKNCTWQGGSTSYTCEEKSCWGFSGTNASACVNNTGGLSCNWRGQCYSDGYSPPGTDCWSITNSSTCGNTIGCKWGQCEQKGCWNSITETTCNATKDWRGNNCTWGAYSSSSSWCECTWASGPGAEHPDGCSVMCSNSLNSTSCNEHTADGCLWRNGWCGEKGCWNYNTEDSCVNAVGINCEWKYNSCSEKDCWTWDFTNSSACINNSLNLSCTWSGSYCNKKSCWNYGETECIANSKCNWRAWTTSGWCEEINCWNWDSWKGGSESACNGNKTLYNLNCVWTSMGSGGGSCSKDYSSISCSNKTTEKECMDTFYCWWQYTNWNNISAGGNCNSPGSFGGTTTNTTMLKDWNPGCYVFDSNASDCGSILGCDNTIIGTCVINSTHANFNEISTNGINCTMINNSQLCTNIPVLSSCCSWQNASCITNKLTTSCWDQMKQKTENSCSDAKTKGKCDEISNSPWYMPCQWTNSTETCDFKSSSVFGNSSQSLTFIDNKKTCEAAGGKWISENYCEGNISIPSGRCEYKFDDEKDCDKACFACEKYDSNGNIVNATNAESACLGSSLNYCEFSENTNAPNGVGYCKAKQQFKKGIVSDCDSNCGDCTYLGTSTSNNTEKRPGYLCGQSKANSVGGGCKWIDDNSTAQGGYCINKGEKTCEDSCDRCKTQTDCSNLGRTSVSNQTGSCKWQEGTNSCVANIAGDVEICWDAIDNNNDNLIDCADPGCYADSYCGFVSGDCFGWITQASCNLQNASCEWVTDKWGSWCDFKGSQCWKYTVNEGNCSLQSNCQWSNGTGSGWCEKDWSKAEACMGLNKTVCDAASAFSCNWTIDSWCAGGGNSSDWCTASGGWCDHTEFAPKNCWSYNSGSLACNAVPGCSWHADMYSTQMCEVNWSANCWQYNLNSTCTTGGCLWKNDSWGGWCTNVMDQCWSSSNQTSCESVSGNKCRWKNESWGGNCEPSCFSKSNSSACSDVSGCSWKAESGWCEESANCWNYDETGCTNATGLDAKCRWKSSGWCDPKGGGFSAGAMASGGGAGGAMGADCYKYDGNQSLCTNKAIINISCGWSINQNPSCEVNWNSNCWQYTSAAAGCNVTNNCWWNPGSGGSGWCTNIMDQCWSNNSYQSWNNTAWLGNCTSNYLCTNNSWSGCEPKCSSLNSASCTNATYLGKCKYATGWCNPANMNEMFTGMEAGASAPLGQDLCDRSETNQSSVDLCGFGMKDMGVAYGFGANVRDFSNSSVCNKEELSSFVMGMFEAGGGAGFAGGGGSLKKIGSGNDTVIYIVYLDTDGSTSGGCELDYMRNSTGEGYEFRFKYTSEWDASKTKAIETFNAYKCENSDWKITDIKLSVWKKKMCSEIGGPMIAVEKADLEKFPTLYDSTKDIRIYVSTIGNTGNISYPTDNAGPGWATPGSIDFEINSAFAYGANMAKFEDILKKGFVEYEECFNGIDDNNDGDIDCNDWGCQYSSKCIGLGVNVAGYVDTSSPLVNGIKIEEYPDSALVMYDTNKPTNGTLQFYGTDSQCLTLNASIYDIGILKNNTIREYKLWHSGEIYYGINSLSYALTNDTTYYYKLKVCDSRNKCAISKCSSFKTSSVAKCSYCNFVTRLKAPTGWNVSYDVDRDNAYEHVQGQVCGPNAGMKTNYTSGRKVNVKLSKSDGSSYIEFLNTSLTKTALNDKVRTLSSSGDIIGDTSKIGMTAQSRDKIINNLHPEVCKIKIPSSGNCTVLYHCDESGNNCTDRTAAAGGIPIDSTNCIWNAPFCEFSTYKTGTVTVDNPPPSGSSGGGGGGGSAGGLTYVLNDEQFKQGYTQELKKGDKIKVNISGEYHFINLTSISSSSVQITITSTPQTAILSIGDIKKFDITNDNYYDLSVKLDSISNSTKAKLFVKALYEKIPEEVVGTGKAVEEKGTEETPKETITDKIIKNTKTGIWIIVFGVIILVIMIIIVSGYFGNNAYKKSLNYLKTKIKLFEKKKINKTD